MLFFGYLVTQNTLMIIKTKNKRHTSHAHCPVTQADTHPKPFNKPVFPASRQMKKIKHETLTFYKFHGGLSGTPAAIFRMFSLSVCGQEITRNPPRNL